MKTVVFNPTTMLWTETVLNNPLPCICCYGDIQYDYLELEKLYEKTEFILIQMENFDEDDPQFDAKPYYLVFKNRKIEGKINFDDPIKFEKIRIALEGSKQEK